MYYLVDLFSGAGGITAGFCSKLEMDGIPVLKPPFVPVLAIDNNNEAVKTYEANFGRHGLAADIASITIERSPDGGHAFHHVSKLGAIIKTVSIPSRIHVVVGGPPCQGFSPLGRMNDWSREDPRNTLWVYFMNVVAELKPDIFLIENVPQILTSRQGQEILNQAHDLGYYLATPGVLDASQFGVPQKRKRAFILGSRIGPLALPRYSNQIRTVRDAFAHLPDPKTDPLHRLRNPTEKSIERYKVIPEGGNRFDLMRERPDITPKCWLDKPTGSTDVMGRLSWNRPALTIRTEFYKPEKGRYLHPSEHRPITHREAAVLQTFPLTFQFSGSFIEIAKQIGNAVPPLLAYHLAKVIHARLENPVIDYPINEVPDLLELKRQGKLQVNGHLKDQAAAL
jgi:DNA (cytosine-5)-methyltransferase 1